MSVRETLMTKMAVIRPRKVEIDGEAVYVRPLPLSSMTAVRNAINTGDEHAATVAMIVGAVCEEDGKPCFISSDADAIAAWPADHVAALVEAINKTDVKSEAEVAGN